MKTQITAVQATETTATSSFSDRIKLLIQHVGSATAIARMCGFSEGVVRSWRDGNTDPSRARCVTLARTLGISLVWLVAGEGGLQTEANSAPYEEQRNSEGVISHRLQNPTQPSGALVENKVDAQRLNTAVSVLQSELSLADSQLSLTDNADLLTQLYEILGPSGSHVDPQAMVAFNQQLGERIRKVREAA
ncbi:transcription factor [Rhodanobacter sp. Root561]|uniref:helix-turn-helix transcriptional regulator n=1 Tax=unclassified Rhodanobacter TaxID=2621553 RepID=UPI0006F961A5|nr:MULTISPECIES: helix-turn-helix transcriptional regulator [unclassified Rhodanobacter]KQZ68049.1 transcription factor [Rhodanobacter sp. Root561]KRB50469.1 transcription factor [Rhodanobacter sp. Root179]